MFLFVSGLHLGVFCDVVADHRDRTVQPVENRRFTLYSTTRPSKITAKHSCRKSNRKRQDEILILGKELSTCGEFIPQIFPNSQEIAERFTDHLCDVNVSVSFLLIYCKETH